MNDVSLEKNEGGEIILQEFNDDSYAKLGIIYVYYTHNNKKLEIFYYNLTMQ